MPPRRSQAGMTLIELIVAFTIMIILSMMVLPLARIKVRREKERELHYALREIREAINSPFCEATLDDDVLSLDVAEFCQASAEFPGKVGKMTARSPAGSGGGQQQTDPRYPRRPLRLSGAWRGLDPQG